MIGAVLFGRALRAVLAAVMVLGIHASGAVAPAEAASPLVAVNAGGPAYTTAGGTPFLADDGNTGFSGGRPTTTVDPVSGTVDDVLYQSTRGGKTVVFLRRAWRRAATR